MACVCIPLSFFSPSCLCQCHSTSPGMLQPLPLLPNPRCLGPSAHGAGGGCGIGSPSDSPVDDPVCPGLCYPSTAVHRSSLKFPLPAMHTSLWPLGVIKMLCDPIGSPTEHVGARGAEDAGDTRGARVLWEGRPVLQF